MVCRMKQSIDVFTTTIIVRPTALGFAFWEDFEHLASLPATAPTVMRITTATVIPSLSSSVVDSIHLVGGSIWDRNSGSEYDGKCEDENR